MRGEREREGGKEGRKEGNMQTHWLSSNQGRSTGLCTHPGKGAKRVIREDVDTAMVCLQVINLLAEYDSPEVLAAELDDIQGIQHSCTVAGETGNFFLIYLFILLI